MRVKRLMSASVYACTSDQSLAEAASLMWKHDVGCVPVVDGDQRPLAMLTDRDISMAAYLRGVPLAEIEVASAMSSRAFTCHARDDVRDAERTMMEQQVRRLPVVNDAGVLLGVLSLNDIVLARTGSALHKVRERLRGRVIDTLAAISRHRLTAPAEID
ncbi:MAG TPA: CBS domain-containing protein [Polyangiales bacterium]|nr:CBS domain-containing protein [Polyangiales bacterium]